VASIEKSCEGKPENGGGVDVMHFKDGKIIREAERIRRQRLKSTGRGSASCLKGLSKHLR